MTSPLNLSGAEKRTHSTDAEVLQTVATLLRVMGTGQSVFVSFAGYESIGPYAIKTCIHIANSFEGNEKIFIVLIHDSDLQIEIARIL